MYKRGAGEYRRGARARFPQVRYQLRIYRLKPETADEFVELWRRDIVPTRRKLGFGVVGAWRRAEGSEFIWMVRWDGQGSFDEGESAYYASPERAAMTWDPADYIASSQLRVIGAVEGFEV